MAAQERKLWKTGAITVAVFAILELTGLIGMQQIASRLGCLLGIPLEIVLETLPSILLRVFHIFQPCAFGHLGLLEGLLQVSASWKLVLILSI